MVSSAQPEAVADEVTANEDEQEPPTLPSPPTPAPVVVPPTAQTKRSEEVFPGSAEEAAALLGASITRCGSVGTHNEVVLPPVGMHPAFAVSSRNNTTELVHRLYHLRALLRTVAASHREKLMQQRLDEAQGKGVEKIPPPLPAAPSILQVLKKLLGVSTQMAAAAPGGTESGAILAATSSSSEKNGTMVQQQKLPATNHSTDPAVVVPQRRVLILKNKLETPPMWSTPCRKLWVECVVLCHALSVSSSSSSSDQATQFVRQMLALASIHPRSAKAAGGVRIAALSVVAALLEHDEDNDNPVYDGTSARPPTYALASQLAPWSLDILQVCLKALRSAGNGEPTFRQAAIRAACATAMACRNAAWKHRNDQASGTADALSFVYPGAMEDKAVMESIKVLKQAATDKFPEVRLVGATYAAVLAPVIVASPSTTASSSHGSHDVLGALEEVIQLALRNLDDEFPAVSTAWAEAVARCMTTAVQYNEATKKSNSQQSSELGGEIGVGADASPSISTQVTRFGSRRPVLLVLSLQTVKKAIGFLVEQFVSVGGELTAAKGGGTFSIGGRMVRLGYSIALFKFLQLQTSPMLSAIGESRSLSIQATISHILDMVGTKTEEQLRNTASRSWSKADASLVRLYTCRVLRQGLSHLATEPTHIAILQDLIGMIPLSNVHDSKESASPKSSKVESLNASQMQVVLVEISHLFATLGEATSSRVSETLTKLQLCMSHDDDGVRHEACIACTALVECFPLQAPKLIESALGAIQDGLAGIGSTPVVKAVEVMKVSLGGFRRPQQPSDSSTEVWRTHEYSIHGRALLVSMLVKDLPKVEGGLSRSILRSVMSVAETLVSCQTNDNVTTLNSDAACVCVRAGFCMISAALTTGPGAIDIHMSQILSNWQNAGKAVIEGGQFFTIQQELSCLDALLSSIVAFLKYCSELLLSIPEALSKITMLLEDMFALVQSNGRLGAVTKDAVVASRLESSKASLLEAFAWLPSGSFPLVSDEVFVFAAAQIRMAVDNNVSCSILCSLIAREDSLLDAKPLCRANKNGQVAGERGMEESITLLTGEIAADSERETVLHLRSVKIEGILEETRIDHRRSSILEAFVSDIKAEKPPTPLHEVGTWRRPADPSCSSQVRIVDAAIQAFSATFGLKDGKEQQGAMDMLEQLVPPLLARFARSIGINTLSENERRAKTKDDFVAVVNITAVLLSCLQALPLHEATHNIPIGLGPPWMNKAKDLLLTLLPSASSIVRRAAAEGLALLATLGVTEDAHFLQSSLLHSLDEVMQGNKLEGKVRILSLDPVSAAKSGSLLTLACIQRTSSNVAQRKRAKARGRVWGSKTDEAVDKSNENLPVLQMMTRILPTSSCHGFKDFFAVKTYALHSFAVLLTYSSRLDTTPLNEEDKQLLRKGVELVEDNFSSAWTAVTVDLDKGPDIEKLSFEVAFVSVIVRLMTYLLPYLHHLQTEDCDAARRFSVLATIILEIYSSLPVVAVECLAFFEVLVYNLPLLSSPAQHVLFSENAMFTCIPRVFAILSPARPMVCLRTFWQSGYQIDSRKTLRAATFLAELMPRPKRFTSQWNDLLLASVLIASFEAVCGSSQFSGGGLLRDVTANREVDTVLHDESALERQLVLAIFSVLLKRSSDHNISFQCTRWILFSRHLLARFVSAESSPSPYSKDNVISQAVSTAEMDCFRVYNTGNPIRWQTKCISAQIAAESLRQLYENERRHDPGIKRSSYFNMSTAIKVIVKECSLASEKAMELPSSRLIFHLEDVLSAVCISSVATSDHAELCTLQENSMHVLARLIDYFGSVDDPEDLSSSILNQFSTQIFSSVKHALSSQPTAAPHSFVTGCLALFSIIENGVTRDPAVLIRLLRPLVLSDESLILLPWSTDTLHQCMMFPEERVVPIHVRVGSVWISSLFMSRDDDYMQKVAKDLFKDILGLAVHSAAVAFDGCQLLFAENLSLVGTMSISGELKPARSSGFFYQSESELDVVVKQMLACGWSQCGLGALNIFLNEFSSGNGDKARQHLCDSWIKAFAPLFLVGVHDAGKSMDARKEEFTVDWAGSIDGTLVLIHCLQGMSLLLKSSFVDWFASEYTVELEQTIKILFDVILIPTISKSKDSTKGHRLATLLVTEACSFTLTVADSCAEGFQEIAIGLLLCLLHPLNQVQGDKIQVSDNPATAEVVETCLLSVGSLIRRGHTTESLVDSMLHLVTSQLLRPDGTIPDKVRGAAKSLLRDCLLHSSLNHQDHERIAINLAETGRWEGWVVVATLDDGLAIVNSLPIVQEAIARSGNLKSQVAAIAAVRSVVQQASENVVGLLLFHVGADSIGALYQNGTMKIIDNARPYRINVCADAMKIILAAYASISRNDSDERMASFLQIVFSIFLAVIRFNGLPNHASPEVSGDPALGRISAQAIVHVARTTPESFKKAVSVLNDRDRTLLEFSVRAEISGYVVVAQANEPAKKKLSLQGYKK